MSIDFSKAVHWHIKWLQDILYNMPEPQKLKPEEIARDDQCEIGQWLRNIEPVHRDLPEYLDLKAIHVELHQLSSEAIKLAQAGKTKEAKLYLSESGECTEKSKQLFDCVSRFLKKMD